jgi:hypothetical protein
VLFAESTRDENRQWQQGSQGQKRQASTSAANPPDEESGRAEKDKGRKDVVGGVQFPEAPAVEQIERPEFLEASAQLPR